MQLLRTLSSKLNKRKYVKLINESRWFDEYYFSRTYKDVPAGSKKQMIVYFLDTGWTKGYNPCKDFNTNYYLNKYPDVRNSNLNPLVHWLLFGLNEGRFCSKDFYEISLIEKSGRFDEHYYVQQLGDRTLNLPPVEHYYYYGDSNNLKPSKDFESSFYKMANPDVVQSKLNTLVHWLLYGSKENRYKNTVEYQIDLLSKSPLFDASFYLATNPDIASSGVNPAQHYYHYGWKEGRNPSAQFDNSFYLDANPDVKSAGINPLVHFILAGSKEKRKPKNFAHDYRVISSSGKFDTLFYTSKYKDIQQSDVDPITHFVENGWMEGRKPAAWFDTNYYLTLYNDVKQTGKNPFVHYVQNGVNEKRRANKFIDLTHFTFSEKNDTATASIDSPVDIILPVYNGLDFLKTLLPQIFERTDIAFNLIIVNDASPDAKVLPLLESYAKKYKNCTLHTNPQNLGFVKSVNVGLQLSKNHVVLLNTDTELPSKWLSRLMAPIIKNSSVASVTPMTNAGTIASFPYSLKDNTILLDMDVEKVDAAFRNFSVKNEVKVPTGIGFCMALNKDAIAKVGSLDDKTFDRGYGEENDWCCRAVKEGFHHIIIPNLFVWHKHGGSFTSEEKKELIKKNTEALVKKHPTYMHEVSHHITADPLLSIRLFAFLNLSCEDAKTGIDIIFDHALGGGANLYTKKWVDRDKETKPVIVISYSHNDDAFVAQVYYKHIFMNAIFGTIEDVYHFFHKNITIDTIHYNNIVSFNAPLLFLRETMLFAIDRGIKQNVYLHDFYSVCQSFVLLDNEGNYCEASTDMNKCLACSKSNPRYEFKDYGVKEWRETWETLMHQCTKIIAFSQSSITIAKKVFDTIPDSKIELVPHQLHAKIERKPELKKTREINIGIVGSINEHKGALVIMKLVEVLELLNWGEVTVIGQMLIPHKQSPRLTVTGKYKHDDLATIIENTGVNVFFFASIWPETFSFVTQELMEFEVPLAAFDIGAPAERIATYDKGTLLSLKSNEFEIIEQLCSLIGMNDRMADIEMYKKIIESNLFDKNFYLSRYNDVASSTMSPLHHYMQFGGFEGRKPSPYFDSAFYLNTNKDVKEIGVNPLIHYVLYGAKENRKPLPSIGVQMLEPAISLPADIKVAVLIHAYYEDLILEMLDATTTIPTNYTVLISVVSHKGQTIVEEWNKVHPEVSIVCKTVINKGRDIAPAFVSFREEILAFDFVCKIHSKKSLYTGAEQTQWRYELIQNMLGTKLYVSNILNAFVKNPDVGLIYPYSSLLPYWAYTWLSNKKIGYDLQNKLQIPLSIHSYADYPMGSMLWFRPQALKQLLDGRFGYDDFPPEPCGNDGTFAHAIERSFVDIAKYNGFTLIEYNYFENVFAKDFGFKNLTQYAQKSPKMLKDQIADASIVTFDVFDTLVSRSIVNPDDVFTMMEKEIDKKFKTKSNFFGVRKQAESYARQSSDTDVSYTQIYKTMRTNKMLASEIIDFAIEREIDLEVVVSTPRPEMIDVFNTAIQQKKKVLLVSDMYMETSHIERLLAKHNIEGYWKIYVSSECGVRKDNGRMWEYLLGDGIITRENAIHIGDNEHSDIQQTIDRGIKHFHVMSANSMFSVSELGSRYAKKFPDWKSHAFLGPILNRMYANPFCFEKGVFPLKKTSPSAFDTGYTVYGPIFLHYFNWLAIELVKNKHDKAFFLAREGYLMKQMYDAFCTLPVVKSQHGKLPESEYLVISRRAVLGAVPKSIAVIREILLNNHFVGTLRDLIFYRFGLDIATIDDEKASMIVKLPDDIDEIMEQITPFIILLENRGDYECENLLAYFDKCGLTRASYPALVDIGYSGTIQRYIHSLSNVKTAGYYLITRDTTQKWTTENNSTKGCLGDNIAADDQLPVFKFNLYIEAWLSAPFGQLSYYEKNDNTGEVFAVYNPLEKVKTHFSVNEQICSGIVEYFKDAGSLCVQSLDELNMTTENVQKIFKLHVYQDTWDNETRVISHLEDKFCGNENIDIITAYKNYVL